MPRIGRALVVLAASLSVLAPLHAADGDLGKLMLEAKAQLREGDGIAAEARLDDALARGAPRKVVAAYMGEALLLQGRADRAAQWLKPADFAPASAAVGFRSLARLERENGNLQAAGAAFDRAIALTPKDAAMWVEIGRLRYVGGEHLLAIDAANHAIRLAPGNALTLLFKGQLVRDSAGPGPSLTYFERAAAAAPRDVVVLGEYAATLGELGHATEMLAVTRKMLEIEPGNPRAFYLQAVMAARAGRYRLARGILARTAGRIDDLPGARLLGGALEIAVGNHAMAIEKLDPLVKQQPANLRARDLLARALYSGGEAKYLTERFAAVAASDQGTPYLRMLVARAYEQLDRRDLAAPLLEQAARPDVAALHPRAGTRIGDLLAAGRIGEAQAAASALLAANPGHYDHLAWAGDAALAAGDAARAADLYQRAARIRQTPSLFERRLQALMAAGRMKDAVLLVEQRLAANPSDRSALRTAGWLAAYAGDWDRARRLYGALAQGGSQRDAQLLVDLALVEARNGDAKGAARYASRAYRMQPGNPLAAQAWGVTLTAARQDAPRARALLDKARKVMGDNPLLAEARLQLAKRS